MRTIVNREGETMMHYFESQQGRMAEIKLQESLRESQRIGLSQIPKSDTKRRLPVLYGVIFLIIMLVTIAAFVVFALLGVPW
jgi:hypothetical protein